MKRSEKSAILAGTVLLILAAYFTISVLVQFFGAGVRPQMIKAFSVGQILIYAYGYSSVAVPIFLFVSAILLFMPNFTTKKAVLLAGSLLPFFTIVACERILNKIVPGSTEPVMILKIVATVFFALLLIAIEYVAISVVCDTISSMGKGDKNKEKAEKKNKKASKIKVVPLAGFAPSSEKSVEQKAVETESIPQTNSEVALESVPVAAQETAETVEETIEEAEEVPEAEAVQEVPEIEQEEKAPVAENLPPENETQVAEETDAAQEPVAQEPKDIPTVEELLSTTEFVDDGSDVPTEKIEKVDFSDFYAEDNDEAKFLEDPFGEMEETCEKIHEEKSEEAPEVKPAEVYSISLDDKKEESKVAEQEANTAEEETKDNRGAQAFILDFNKKTAMSEELAEKQAIEKARRDYPEFMSEEEKMNRTVPLMDIKLGEDDPSDDLGDDLFEDENKNDPIPSGEFEEVEADFFDESFNDTYGEKVTYEKEKIIDPSAATVFGSVDEMPSDSSFNFKPAATAANFDDVEEIEENTKVAEEKPSEKVHEEFEEFETSSVSTNEFFDDSDDDEEIEEDVDNVLDNVQDEIEVPVPAESKVAVESAPAPAPKAPKKSYRKYSIPSDELLTTYPDNEYWIIDEETKQKGAKLKEILNEFKIEAEVTGIKKGPVITMFELVPAPGVKLSRIVGLSDNIALGLAAPSVRIVAPIPGKSAVGIEIPNKERAIVSFKEIIETDTPAFKKMAIPVVLGKDITGEAQLLDLAKTPHLLIAGATGAGKSVCVNSLILSILYKRSPDEVKLILVDPKVVELKLYNDIPHLLTPVITEPKRAFQSLQYCLCEMERRYSLLDGLGVRDIVSYNNRIVERNIATEKLPYIVVIIDEFADLMATTGKELESTIARLAAMSRAVGIHLVLATQRPSIDVITGLIKANIPTRIAFMVASKMDSRIIIDQVGADKLLGKGDMLYASATDPFPVRIQGTYVSDNEVENVVNYVKQFGEPEYIDEEIFVDDDEDFDNEPSLFGDGEDPLYNQALEIVVQAGKASASYLQRRLKIGYNRAARLVEEMEERGIVGPANGAKPREIIHMP